MDTSSTWPYGLNNLFTSSSVYVRQSMPTNIRRSSGKFFLQKLTNIYILTDRKKERQKWGSLKRERAGSFFRGPGWGTPLDPPLEIWWSQEAKVMNPLLRSNKLWNITRINLGPPQTPLGGYQSPPHPPPPPPKKKTKKKNSYSPFPAPPYEKS